LGAGQLEIPTEERAGLVGSVGTCSAWSRTARCVLRPTVPSYLVLSSVLVCSASAGLSKLLIGPYRTAYNPTHPNIPSTLLPLLLSPRLLLTPPSKNRKRHSIPIRPLPPPRPAQGRRSGREHAPPRLPLVHSGVYCAGSHGQARPPPRRD
jgi:hypothetical protein